MPIDDVKGSGGPNEPRGDEHRDDDNNEQTFTETFLESITAFGNAVRGLCVETGKSLRGCAYPVKERFFKAYDTVTNNFDSKGTRNMQSVSHITRFGNKSPVSSEAS
ncbi:conserved hypothetical protein [Theileria equi strain WA]|uniref:Uncharacterized protein n=1 Tax=Theileria equi strain WA TaxID=1537102 RepID=L1LCK7_THEEQ|nr:conserved hypothetical protein [Theileria equi strain WA]EKX72893.1 conserved hypothetical protein [Theileria equi strain WA]|eukprot:XP_004832345.1 conserved hypothetical protein [Theileria equi strain WA]